LAIQAERLSSYPASKACCQDHKRDREDRRKIMQWSIRRAMEDAVFAWITLPVSILISAFLFAILSVNHFSEIVSISVPFGVMCIILTGAHVLRGRPSVLAPLLKEFVVRFNILQAKTLKLVRPKKDDFATSMHMIQEKQSIIIALHKKLADPLTPSGQKADIETRIKELENEVEALFRQNIEILYTLDGARTEHVLKESHEKSSG
jgi:hypothetical protein